MLPTQAAGLSEQLLTSASNPPARRTRVVPCPACPHLIAMAPIIAGRVAIGARLLTLANAAVPQGENSSAPGLTRRAALSQELIQWKRLNADYPPVDSAHTHDVTLLDRVFNLGVIRHPVAPSSHPSGRRRFWISKANAFIRYLGDRAISNHTFFSVSQMNSQESRSTTTTPITIICHRLNISRSDPPAAAARFP
jgi:hypothetical protein